MLKILLISVHPVLEYDERLLFNEMGHSCFSLGFFSDFDCRQDNSLRQSFPTSEFTDYCKHLFFDTECSIDYNEKKNYTVTEDFILYFDVVVVHHNYSFIGENWKALCCRPIVWRSIGQELSHPENYLRSYRSKGMHIVRWSEAERLIDGYMGEDIVIRAFKKREDFLPWQFSGDTIVTFNNNFSARKDSLSKDIYDQVTKDFKSAVYGVGNDDLKNNGGVIPYSEQRNVLKTAGAAFITGTWPAPYTLGFIEAWMAGTPVVHLGEAILHQKFQEITFEIPLFLQNGVNGFIANSANEAISSLKSILGDQDYAESISHSAVIDAEKYFGFQRAVNEWEIFFRKFII